MNDVIVVTGATHRDGMLDEYEQQLANAGIDFHIEPFGPLPNGANSVTIRARVNLLREAAQRFHDYSRMVVTDAWDVLFYGTKDALLARIPDTLVISAERNCYPEPHLAPLFTSTSPWRFVNAGLYAGTPQYIFDWCQRVEEKGEHTILDQAWLNRRKSEGSDLVPLDENTDLFYTVSSTQEDGSLMMHDGRPWNAHTGSHPLFFHFSGKCPTESFREMLVNGTPLG